jgi:endonuclease YncB( thermonuclease family)
MTQYRLSHLLYHPVKRSSLSRHPLRLVALLPFALPVLGGCTFLEGPEPEPKPEVPPKPKTEIFVPTDHIVAGTQLPGFYRLAGAASAELITLSTVVTTQKGGRNIVTYGVPETMRLAGIEAPAPGQPGWQSSVRTVLSWAGNKNNLVVEQDKVYPLDLERHRRVQVYFTPTTGAYAGQKLNLNRMLIRSGYAIVDLYQPTHVDLQQWLIDEESARGRIGANGKPDPQGLWKLGIILDHRLPPPKPSAGPTPTPVAAPAPAAEPVTEPPTP